MAVPTRSRLDVACRVASRLGIELGPELLEIVPPVAWDEFPTRTELRDERRRQAEDLERRLRAVRDALVAAHHDDVHRLRRRSLVIAAAAAAGLATVLGHHLATRS